MEPWERNLQNLRDIRQAQTAASTAALLQGQSMQRGAQAAQARNQENLLQELIFEQQIAGFSETEKSIARQKRNQQIQRERRDNEVANKIASEALAKSIRLAQLQDIQDSAIAYKRWNIAHIVFTILFACFIVFIDAERRVSSLLLGLFVGFFLFGFVRLVWLVVCALCRWARR